MDASITFPGLKTKLVKVTASGSLVIPAGVYEVFAKAIGGGGGGSGGYTTTPTYGSGGGSGFVREVSIPVTPGETLTIAVGGGGSGGAVNTSGSTGGTTTVSRGATVLLTAPGGYGGVCDRAQGGRGQANGNGPGGVRMGGSGGSGWDGEGGYGTMSDINNIAGSNGSGYGSGGGGGAHSGNHTTGTNGSSGAVFFYYAQSK